MYQAKHAAKSPREISKKKRKSSSVLQAAGMLTVMMALSRILGFVRDISVSSTFGISWQADAYSAACETAKTRWEEEVAPLLVQ